MQGKNDELVENGVGLLARLRWNAYELEECAWKVCSGVRKRVPLACEQKGFEEFRFPSNPNFLPSARMTQRSSGRKYQK